MTEKKRVNLYERLPEIYRIKDQELAEKYLYADQPAAADQLKSFLEPVEEMFSKIHENIESLYHDFFIETCDEWVIPYIADLLGTSHLKGDAWTLRADVADTIALRRRKGTLGAIELLTYILTKWGVHSVELRENLLWNQHLNHQRPDEGGALPYGLPKVKRSAPVRGGTVNLRDPSLLALLTHKFNQPFDPFAHVVDVRPSEIGQVRYNLPNLAIYLWRLQAFRLDVTKPLTGKAAQKQEVIDEGGAPVAVRVNVNPIPINAASRPYVIVDVDPEKDNQPEGQPVTLFNTNRFDLYNQENKLNPASLAPRVSSLDQVSAPIPVERISDFEIAKDYDKSLNSSAPQLFEIFAEASFTAPQEYVSVETYDEMSVNLQPTLQISDVGFQLHLPNSVYPNAVWLHRVKGRHWTIRGENLCAWEKGINPVLKDREIAIDPKRGRVVIGAADDAHADALIADLLLTFTYGAVGAVGAHPISYAALPKDYDVTQTPTVNFHRVKYRENPNGLRDALAGIATRGEPTVIEIADSRTHLLDLNDVALAADVENEGGIVSLKLNAPLIIRAADNQRPIIELVRPLAFRPVNVVGADDEEQKSFDAATEKLFVRLEGLFLTRNLDFAANLPLIGRAALDRLEILSCTLDPGGFRRFDDTRAPFFISLKLSEPYGFADADEELQFKQTPEIEIQRSVCGRILIDAGYRLCLIDSIIDAGQGVGNPNEELAVTNATDEADGWAAATIIRNVTVFGRVRTAAIEGGGGIFVHAVEVENQQMGCLKYCYFSGEAKDRLPQHHACVKGTSAVLLFTSETFGDAAYGQLSLRCDRRILEEGGNNDQMGAFNFLQEAHKWRNLQIRFREFMPVGVRPLLIPVT